MIMRFGLGRFLAIYFVLLTVFSIVSGAPVTYWMGVVAFYGLPYLVWTRLPTTENMP